MLKLLLLLCAAHSVIAKSCRSFSVNSTSAHFDYYRFYDFRNLAAGPLYDLPERSTQLKSLSVGDIDWSREWNVREQQKRPPSDETIEMHYVKENIWIEREGFNTNSTLNFMTRRINETLQTAAELDFTATNISHASLRVMARISGSSGAVAGFFTYFNDTQEADIEVLTRDEPGRIHFSTQPTTDDDDNSIAGATFNMTGPDYTNWNVYRMDWLPDEMVWFVNGVETQRTSVHVPETESMFILNLWSNAGRFSGSMEEGSSATMQVQWVEMVFNRQMGDSVEQRRRGTVCAVDKVLGSPEPVSNARRGAIVYSRWLALLVFSSMCLHG